MPKKYPLEFKKQAIRRYEKGESIPALCQELHISQSTFYHWRNQYRSIQTSAHTYTPAKFDALVRRIQKAEHKLSIIQLSGYLPKVPLQDKRTSWPLWSIFTTKCLICTAFTNYAKPWMCPAVHSTITFSAAQIEANTNPRRLNSC